MSEYLFYKSKVGDSICWSNEELKGDYIKLEANTTDGALEKHVPVYSVANDIVTVEVGEIPHPMIESHYISYIAVITDNEVLEARLQPGVEPKITFKLNGGVVKEVYAYCNLHGLWVKKAK